MRMKQNVHKLYSYRTRYLILHFQWHLLSNKVFNFTLSMASLSKGDNFKIPFVRSLLVFVSYNPLQFINSFIQLENREILNFLLLFHANLALM